MNRRKLLVSIVATIAIALLVFIILLFRRIDVESPPLPLEGDWTRPKISTDSASGMASMEISVLDYNVAGLPFPIGCGKSSRLTDEAGKRIPIACNRSKGVGAIGDALADLRVRGIEPDIVLLQEAFIPAVAEISGRAGYPNWIAGPGPNDTGPRVSERASESFIANRSFWKGEKWGKRQPSGLLIASNFQIVEQFNFPFYEWECAGFDCLANKGVVMARIRIPSLPDLLEVVTTHYNAKKASGVPLERAHAAHKLQVDATVEFIRQTSDYELPMIWGGDLNMRRSEDRIGYFIEQSGAELNEVSSYCLRHADRCRMRVRTESDKPWFETQDLQGWGSGKRVTVEPISVEEIFDLPVDGKMLSDHSGFLVVYRLSWMEPDPG
jgi:endonuclease/exonuclease/phosphatase family metal-dependent hydrolase